MAIGFLTTVAPAFAASKEQVLYSFTGGLDGGYPDAPLVFDSNGNLYGTTGGGGANGDGTVFELTPANGGWTETTLYSFCSLTNCADGANPLSALVFDSEGNLYGTTYDGGGGASCGTVFELTPVAGAWTESVLHAFAGADGCYPYAGVILDSSGNVYGTTAGGGVYHGFSCFTSGCGTVFELASGVWTETVLHSFHVPNSNDGLAPEAALVFGHNGNLYGTTAYGGDAGCGGGGGCGTVFELASNARGGWTERVIHRFQHSTTDGARPHSALILDKAGKLFGTASFGAGGLYGSVFEMSPGAKGTWSETVLHNFTTYTKGAGPNGLVFDAKGNLYGTTGGGGVPYLGCFGEGGCGVVFRLSPSRTAKVLHDFQPNGKDGTNSHSALVLGPDGNLYGTTYWGGTGACTYNGDLVGCGTVFEITP